MNEFTKPTPDSCPEIDPRLTDFLVGELPAADRRRVEQHLLDCASCRAELEMRRAAMEMLAHSRPQPALSAVQRAQVLQSASTVPPARRPINVGSMAFGSIAATILIMLGAFLAFRSGDGEREMALQSDLAGADELRENLSVDPAKGDSSSIRTLPIAGGIVTAFGYDTNTLSVVGATPETPVPEARPKPADAAGRFYGLEMSTPEATPTIPDLSVDQLGALSAVAGDRSVNLLSRQASESLQSFDHAFKVRNFTNPGASAAPTVVGGGLVEARPRHRTNAAAPQTGQVSEAEERRRVAQIDEMLAETPEEKFRRRKAIAELNRARVDKEQVQQSLTDMSQEYTALQKGAAETAERQMEDLASRLEVARRNGDRTEYDRLALKLTERSQEYATLQRNAADDRATIEALTLTGVVIDKPAPALDGAVVQVRPESNLVILSIGTDDKVQIGHEFTIYRGDRFVGKVRVIKVTPDLAGARILYLEDDKTVIRTGDKASTRIGEGGGSVAATPTPDPGPSPAEAREARVQAILAGLKRRAGETPDMMFFRYWGDNPFVRTSQETQSTFGIDVDTASYTLARNYLRQGLIPPTEAIRTEEFVNYFPSNYEAPTSGDFAIYTDLAPSVFAHRPQVHLLKVGIKAREVPDAERKPTALTLVLDVSGSMARENRIDLVKEAIRALLPSLDERDSIGLVTFNTSASVVMKPVAADRIDTIFASIDPLVAAGSTNVQQGLEFGYAMALEHYKNEGNNRVVLLSDGVANTGLTDAPSILGQIEEARTKGIFLNTFGVGMGNHNDALLEQLADKGDGQCAYIDSLQEAKRLFEKNLTGLFETVAKDAKIQVEFDPSVVLRFRQIGYENRAIANQDFRNDAVDAGEVSAGHEVVALYELEFLRNAADKPAAVVRLRYQQVETSEVIELERAVARSEVRRFENAPPRFRLSACVAGFAEILRDSYWARQTNLSEIQELADSLLVLEKGEDQRIAELVALMRQAEGLLGQREPGELARAMNALKKNTYLRETLRELLDQQQSIELQKLEDENRRLEDRIRKILGG